MLLLWTENLRVGVEEFDADHKRLLAMVNRLHGAIQAGTSKEILAGILDALEHHAWDHCGREEMLFMQAGYPGAAQQLEDHDELRRMIAGMKLRHASGSDADLCRRRHEPDLHLDYQSHLLRRSEVERVHAR